MSVQRIEAQLAATNEQAEASHRGKRVGKAVRVRVDRIAALEETSKALQKSVDGQQLTLERLVQSVVNDKREHAADQQQHRLKRQASSVLPPDFRSPSLAPSVVHSAPSTRPNSPH